MNRTKTKTITSQINAPKSKSEPSDKLPARSLTQNGAQIIVGAKCEGRQKRSELKETAQVNHKKFAKKKSEENRLRLNRPVTF